MMSYILNNRGFTTCLVPHISKPLLFTSGRGFEIIELVPSIVISKYIYIFRKLHESSSLIRVYGLSPHFLFKYSVRYILMKKETSKL